MTPEIITVLVILAIALGLFVTERLRIDLVALLVLVSLGLTGLVTPEQAFSGFGNPAVITVWAVFILSGGLARTGVAGMLGRLIHRIAGSGEARLILVLMLVAAALSAFMNNVGVAALLMPALMDIARRQGISPSRLLMPLSFATLLGGMLTLIGTPPNLLLASELALVAPGLEFQMFDFTGIGLAVTFVGIVYMLTIGRRLLPDRDPASEGSNSGQSEMVHYGLRDRLFTITIPEGSALAGRSLATSRIGLALGLNVMAVVREGETRLAPEGSMQLRVGDRLVVKGRPETLDFHISRRHIFVVDDDPAIRQLISKKIGMAILTVDAKADVIGETLASTDFRNRFGVLVLEIRREGRPVEVDINYQSLQPGDQLLVQGDRKRLRTLDAESQFSAADAVSDSEAAAEFDLNRNLFVVRVTQDSPVAGRSLAELRPGTFGMTVVGQLHDGHTKLLPSADSIVEAGDRLLVKARPEHLAIMQSYHDLIVSKENVPELSELVSERVGLEEVVLSPHTRLVGKTLRDIHFRAKYGLSVLAIWRDGRAMRSRVKDIPLRFGDALLLYGRRSHLKVLAQETDFLVLTEGAQEEPRRERAAVAAIIMIFGVIVPAVFFKVPIALAAVAGALAMVLSGCLTMDEAYRYIQWPAVFLIAGMLPMGIAMEGSGAAEYLAGGMLEAIGGYGEIAIMAGLFTMAALASQVMPNPAVAVLLAPIAVSAADPAAGISIQRLFMTIAISSSSSFFSPVGHPANILVMGPGGYRFKDYVRVGLPLTFFVMIVSLIVIPIFIP